MGMALREPRKETFRKKICTNKSRVVKGGRYIIKNIADTIPQPEKERRTQKTCALGSV